MRRSAHPVVTLLALVLTLVLAVVGSACSGGDETARAADGGGGDGAEGNHAEEEEEPRLEIDPRSYFDNYRPGQVDMAASGATTSAPTPAAPSVPGPPGGAATAGPAGPAGAAAAEADRASGDAGSAPGAGSTAGVAPSDVPPPPAAEPEPGFLDDNTFTDPGTNTFVATADDPRSTFALDVDTGSYTIGRTFLTQGYRPDPASVRTEEWVNAFHYDYRPPEDGDLAIHVDGAPAPFADDGTRLVRVGIQGRSVDREDRPPAAVTLVVDTSGSMDIRERLGLVQSSLAVLALQLRDDDTVAAVTFADAARVVLPPTPVVEAERIVGAIAELAPSGGTNMEAGLREGYTQARAAFRPGAINTVVLASDGVANLGVTGTDPLSDLVRSEGEAGISLVTVGYGMGNYNDQLMEQLADRGDGFYSYVDTYEEAERLFGSELTSTLTIIAEDTRAQVAFDPDAVASYRLVGYENRGIADESFRDDAVDAGELGSGHTVTALYEIRLAAGVAERASDGGDDEGDSDGGELGTVTVRHRPAGAEETVEQETPIALDDLTPDLAEAPRGLRLAAAVAAFAELLADHPVARDRGVSLDGLADLMAGLVDRPATAQSDGGGRDAAAPGDGIAPGEPAPGEPIPTTGGEPFIGRPDAAQLARLIDLARSGAAPVPTPEPEPVLVPAPAPTPGPVPGPIVTVTPGPVPDAATG